MKSYTDYLQQILYILGEDRKKLPSLIFLFIIASLMDLIGISFIAPYAALMINPDAFMKDHDITARLLKLGFEVNQNQLIFYFSLALIVVFFFKMLLATFINWSILSYCYGLSSKLRSKLMGIYQNLPYVDHVGRNSSTCIHNIQALAPQFSLTILQSLLRLLSEGLMVFFIIILLAWYNPLALTILVLLFAVTMISYDRFFRVRIHQYGVLANTSSNQMLRGINEGIHGLKEVRILGKEHFFLNAVSKGASDYSDSSKKSAFISSMPKFFLEFVLIIFITSLVLATLKLENNFQILLPTLGMFAMASLRLMPSANQLLSGLSQIRFGRNTVEQLFQDLKYFKSLKLDVSFRSSAQTEIDFESLELKNVSFYYPERTKPALDHINISIQKNECIGFVGQSGSGKTTLIDLVMGLLKPQQGELLFNQKDLFLSLDQFRHNVAYLPQEIFLIDDTLKKNVALGILDPAIEMSRLELALKRARLDDLVNSLPLGVNTILGERGVRLSGGQRQRIALARAFYHGRNFLIMDEATSALDQQTEQEIITEIRELKGSVTQIIIAHRVETLKYCDRIYKLNNGQVESITTYAALIEEMRKNK